MTHPQTQDDEALVEARDRARMIRNRIMVHMAMTGETADPNWQEEAAVRAMLEFCETARESDSGAEVEAMARALLSIRIQRTDETWQRYRQPDSWKLFEEDATAVLTALRNHEGRK